MNTHPEIHTDSAPNPIPFGQKLRRILVHFGPYAGLVLISSLIIVQVMEPESRQDSHEWRMKLAALAGVLLLFRFAKIPLKKALKKTVFFVITRIYFAVLAMACTFGVFNYYQFDMKVADGLGDLTDITYYYMNTKYLKELGYFRFYAATLYADKTNNDRHASHIRHYRDLRDYEVKSTRIALAHGKEIKEKYFTPARWKQFQYDVDWFLKQKSRRGLQGNFFVDHGYNPPPTWAVLGGFFSDLAPVNEVKKIAMVDVAFVLAMFIAVAWAFGFEAMLFVMLFWLTTFSGRWPMLGTSLLRFDWSSCLVLAICMLKKDKWMPAGAILTLSALSRIFPAIFFLAWGVRVVVDTIRERKILKKHLRFAAGALLMGGLIIGTAFVRYGPEPYKESAKNLLMHNASYSSHRVGLGDIIMYRGETTRAEINENGGIRPKEIAVQEMQTELRLIGLAAILFAALYITRCKRPLSELIGLATIPLFCMTNPQINYYYVRLTLVVWHTALLHHPVHKIGLILLFAVEVATQWAFLQGWARYAVTVTTSMGMAFYFCLLVIYMSFVIVRSFITKRNSASA